MSGSSSPARALPFAMPDRSPPASKQQLLAFFKPLEGELEKVEFFRPPDKRDTMQINLRNIFTRMEPTQQDIRTLHGVITAIAEGRKGPARGGLLNGDEAALLRTLLAEHGAGPGAERARPGARAGAAAAPQSDRGRAHVLGRVHARPALRRPRLQAAGAGRPAHHRRRVVSAAGGDRARARRRGRDRGRGARRAADAISPSAAIAWSMWRWRRWRRMSARCWTNLAGDDQPFSTLSCAAVPARRKPRSLPTARKRTPRLAQATARSALAQ